MWIALNNAFLSIVAHRDKPDTLLVRARLEGDIERVFPDAAVQETPAADYRFRTEVTRDAAGETLGMAIAAIDYDNFKGSVSDPDRHRAYFEVWATLRDLQAGTADVEPPPLAGT